MSPAKVTLSPKELELVNNADWILTKNAVIGKVYELFGQLSEYIVAELAKHPSLTEQGIDFRSPKISKGEQYEGLPWVMLDHPRHFTNEIHLPSVVFSGGENSAVSHSSYPALQKKI
jgi:hypothetical protein